METNHPGRRLDKKNTVPNICVSNTIESCYEVEFGILWMHQGAYLERTFRGRMALLRSDHSVHMY